MIPQHDSRLRMELSAGRCGPAERGDMVRRRSSREKAQLLIQIPVLHLRGLTSTSSPVVYISSLMKSTAAGSPHTWISSAHRPTQTQRHNGKFQRRKWCMNEWISEYFAQCNKPSSALVHAHPLEGSLIIWISSITATSSAEPKSTSVHPSTLKTAKHVRRNANGSESQSSLKFHIEIERCKFYAFSVCLICEIFLRSFT